MKVFMYRTYVDIIDVPDDIAKKDGINPDEEKESSSIIDYLEANTAWPNIIDSQEANDPTFIAAEEEGEELPICPRCFNLKEECVCEEDVVLEPMSNDIGETSYDGDGV